MKAAFLHGAMDLRFQEYATPGLSPGMLLIKVNRVGICGSDLHYYEHGYCGSFVPSQPFILGHELTGEIVAVHPDTKFAPAIGTRVTVNPARACRVCYYCKSGRSNLCPNTIMLGSGSTIPPTNGAMAEFVAVNADQCHILPEGMDDSEGTMMEPLAVALHAVKRPGLVSGKSVLVTGGGTIGLLTALVARTFGALPVVVSDIVAERRNSALELGIDATLDPADKFISSRAKELTRDGFDIIFEASGAPPALRQSFDLVKAGGTIVQIGTLGSNDIPLPANMVMTKEIQLIGSFRYGNVFDEAIQLVHTGRIDISRFITGILPFKDISKAMQLAGDRIRALKVQIDVNK